MSMMVLLELEETLRAKGGLSAFEEQVLQQWKDVSVTRFAVSAVALALPVWFGAKWYGIKPFHRFYYSAATAYLGGMLVFKMSFNDSVGRFLEYDGQRMQMELAKSILTKHSDSADLVGLVRRHFFPEQVFVDLYGDKPLCRWRPRHSYAGSTFLGRTEETEDFMERTEETQDVKADDKGKSVVTRQATSPFGDLMSDPLECILGSSGGEMENRPSDNAGTLPKRERRAHRRAHRHHRRHAHHADNAAAV